MEIVGNASEHGFDDVQLKNVKRVFWSQSPAELVEHALARNEGILSSTGALVVDTGIHTGRSPNDKFFVNYGNDDDKILDWGKVNKPISPEHFERLHAKCLAYLQNKDLFVMDVKVGADPAHTVPVRVISEKAWAALFANDLFIRLTAEEKKTHKPELTILHCPELTADPATDGTVSGTFVIANLTKNLILIGGTSYCGEIKKSVFTILNYLLPKAGVMPMHCSANLGKDGDVAIFFGLSGTGKTTLSSDVDRRLIGDDEHGWSDSGVFNFEGGCYAKMIDLNPEFEPIIYGATRRFGTVLENVILDPVTREPDFFDGSRTENTRGAYPIYFVENYVPEGYGGHPTNVFFLTADAFGVLPPIAKLTEAQAKYYFLAGYTSKLAGTEKGLGSEPQATFSACFGAPFMPLHPSVYANLLGEKIREHKTNVWLINTGWTGGPYGVGKRFKLPYTRAMVRAAILGELNNVETVTDEIFGLHLPVHCPGVPDEVLQPQMTWSDKAAYVEQAKKLVERFEKNFEQFKDSVDDEVVKAGPRLSK